jgi:hypothetical protein
MPFNSFLASASATSGDDDGGKESTGDSGGDQGGGGTGDEDTGDNEGGGATGGDVNDGGENPVTDTQTEAPVATDQGKLLAIEICDNGVDDDGDEQIDFNDPDCKGNNALPSIVTDNGTTQQGLRVGHVTDNPTTSTPPSGPRVPEICGDGIDNNGFDGIDEGCIGVENQLPGGVRDVLVPGGTEENGGQAAPPDDVVNPRPDGKCPPGYELSIRGAVNSCVRTKQAPPPVDDNGGSGTNNTKQAPPPSGTTPDQMNKNNLTRIGNTTNITINNAIAQAFSKTAYNSQVLQQAVQNTLIVGEETIPLQGTIGPGAFRLLSTFDPFRLIGGSAIVYLPTVNIEVAVANGLEPIQVIAVDGDTNEMVILPSVKMPIEGNAYKVVLGESFTGINPITGNEVNVDNIKALFLSNGLDGTITFGDVSSIAILSIVR